jgi:DNA processing protein
MLNKSDPVLFWIGLSSIPGVGRVTFRKLVTSLGSPERVLAMSRNELERVGGLSRKVCEAVSSFQWRGPAEKERERAERAGVVIVTWDDPAYPGRLKNIPDPPPYLYVRGKLEPGDDDAVALVGTRSPTHYGTAVTGRLAEGLASRGFTIVSGMARGIDTCAHRGALDAGGRTIAVLGCGIDIAYPPENRGLMEDISLRGAVVTENPFGTKPEAGYFPARNRIISGLSRGTVIIEASEDSGSLITARYAVDHGRKLFAVPGNAGAPVSRGANSLIKKGAILVEDAVDVLRGLGEADRPGGPRTPQRPLPLLTSEEEASFRCVPVEPKHIDVIRSESGLTAGMLAGVLTALEIKGLVKQLPGKYFIRIDS